MSEFEKIFGQEEVVDDIAKGETADDVIELDFECPHCQQVFKAAMGTDDLMKAKKSKKDITAGVKKDAHVGSGKKGPVGDSRPGKGVPVTVEIPGVFKKSDSDAIPVTREPVANPLRSNVMWISTGVDGVIEKMGVTE